VGVERGGDPGAFGRPVISMPFFQAMGGEAVAQTVYSAPVGQPGLWRRRRRRCFWPVALLMGAKGSVARKEEDLGVGLAVVVAQDG